MESKDDYELNPVEVSSPVLPVRPSAQSQTQASSGSALRSMANAHRRITVLRAKVLLVGDPAVGKSALVSMLQSGGSNYPKSYLMTLGVDLQVKDLAVGNKADRKVELLLFDIGGQSIFHQAQLSSQHFRSASVAVIVYDAGNRQSFLSCAKWLSAVRSENNGRVVPGILLANKSDLVDKGRIQVTKEEGRQFASKNGLTFMEASALRNTGVQELFQFIADAYSAKYEDSMHRVADLV
jgi:transport family protein 27